MVWEGDEGVDAIGSTERRTRRVSGQILALRSYEGYHSASSSVERIVFTVLSQEVGRDQRFRTWGCGIGVLE